MTRPLEVEPDDLELEDDEEEEEEEKQSRAEVLAIHVFEVSELLKSTVVFFHDEAGNPYATVPMEHGQWHSEMWAVKSDKFKTVLRGVWFKKNKYPIPSKQLKELINLAEAQAEFYGTEREVYIRVAGDSSGVYVDLCNATWQQVCITKTGWRIIESKESPITFVRAQGMLALPYPKEDPKGMTNLDKFLSHLNPDSRILCKAFMLGCFNPKGKYPTMILTGQQGAGKSTISTIISSLIDPSETGASTMATNQRDMMIAASKSWLPVYDNVSQLTDNMQDSICRLNSGIGFRTRAMRMDTKEIILKAKRPLILNSINVGVVTRPDLGDRALMVHCNNIDETKRRVETSHGGTKGLMDEFNEQKAGILGALLTAVSVCLRNEGRVIMKSKPRMADFAQWVVAGEEAIGAGFMDAYARSRAAVDENTLEAAPIYAALLHLVAEEDWHGELLTLFELLTRFNDHAQHPMHDFPRTTSKLRDALDRIAPPLKTKGITVTFLGLSVPNRRRLLDIKVKR